MFIDTGKFSAIWSEKLLAKCDAELVNMTAPITVECDECGISSAYVSRITPVYAGRRLAGWDVELYVELENGAKTTDVIRVKKED